MIQKEEMSFNEKQPITLRNSVDEEQKVRVKKITKEEWDAEKEDGCQAMLVPRGHVQSFGL